MPPSRHCAHALEHALLIVCLSAGCARSRSTNTTVSGTPDPRSDSSRAARLSIGGLESVRTDPGSLAPRPGGSRPAPGAASSVAPGAPPNAAPDAAAPSPALPSAAPSPVPEAAPSASPPGATTSPDVSFQPPVLRQSGPLQTPPGRKRGQVELELRVNEDGLVDEFRLVGVEKDTLLIRAALDNVRVMRFDPALRAGKPVPAWCRRTFTFGGR
jgi:TonB family protein